MNLSILKKAAKRALFKSGALDVYRRAAQVDTLTVAMFHRVLPPFDPRFDTADPAYTMQLATFEQCLDTFAKHYDVVSLQAVEAALQNRKRLPKHALLVTFDDGWEDTARYAVPALHRRNMPSVVFVTSGAVGSSLTLWKDAAACLWRASEQQRQTHQTIGALVEWLAQHTPAERDLWLREAIAKSPKTLEPMMMSAADLRRVQNEGAAIGGHGATHTSLTEVADVDGEATRCRRDLTEIMKSPPSAFAFPNGRYNAAAVAAVARAGFGPQFTSEPWLNTASGTGATPLFGRIDIPESAIVDENGNFREERLAFWLAMRPVRPIGRGLTA